MEILRAKPFFLDDEALKWVYETLGSMTQEEKIGQLFCPLLAGNLEMGGSIAASDGTMSGSPMQAAATDDLDLARAVAKVICLEGKSVGIN
jgi:beta-N-acetylhexosaminidase